MTATQLPDYKLMVKSKTNNRRTEIGAAWVKENGRIAITLNPCVVLSMDDDLLISMFPNKKAEPSFPKMTVDPWQRPETPEVDDDDIPF